MGNFSINDYATYIDEVAHLDWNSSKRQIDVNESKQIVLFHPYSQVSFKETILNIQSIIQSTPDLLNSKQVVDNLFTIEFKAEQIGLEEAKVLYQLIKGAPSLDCIKVKTRIGNEERSKHFPGFYLALRSSYFATLINGPFKKLENDEISFQEEAEETVQLILEYLETGHLNLTNENILDILQLADKYQLIALKDKCQAWILQQDPQLQSELLSTLADGGNYLLKDCLANQLAALYLEQSNFEQLKNLLAVHGSVIKSFVILPNHFFLLELVLNDCPNLQSLDLSGCSQLDDETLKQIANRLTSLNNLNVSGCSDLTNASITQVAKQLKALTDLDLSLCFRITDESIIQIANHSHQLLSLNLSCCSNITDTSITQIAKNLTQLTNLNLGFCKKLTDSSIIQVAEHLKQLLNLNLSGSNSLTSISIIQIAKQLKHLKNLDLYGCFNLTHDSIDHIAKHLTQLSYLNLSFCKHLTNESLMQLIKSLKQLEHLNVIECSTVSPSIINQLRSDFKQLKIDYLVA